MRTLFMVGLVGCAPARAPMPHRSSAPAPARELVFSPSGAPAARYGSRSDGGRTALTDAVLAAAGAVPAWDARLAAAARDLAATVPSEETVGYSVIEFALHHYGIVEPTPHLLVMFSNRRDDDALAGAVAGRVASLLAERTYHRIGIGVAERGDRRAVVVGLQASHVDLDPVPRQVAAGGRVELRGRLRPPFREPEVLVTSSSGTVEPVAVRERRGRFTARIPCDGGDRVRIEISGVSEEGSSVLANFPVYCGAKPPVVLRTLVSGPVDLSDLGAVEQRLVDLINQDRRRAGLVALAVDPEVADVARAYSAEMARTGDVVHVSAESGAADDRLRRAGVLRPLVQENLARAATPDEAHRSLMNSPGHRANILSEMATHVGIGVVAAGANDLLVTELFTRIPPPVDPERARAVLVERAREALGVRLDEALHEIAQTHASRMANDGGGHAEQIRDSAAIQELSQFRGVRVMMVAISNVDQLGAEKFPADVRVSHVGIGVGQGHHHVLGEGAIYVVVLLGVAR